MSQRHGAAKDHSRGEAALEMDPRGARRCDPPSIGRIPDHESPEEETADSWSQGEGEEMAFRRPCGDADPDGDLLQGHGGRVRGHGNGRF